MAKSFTEKVHQIVQAIPKGKVLSYAQVAQLAGSPRAARAVGTLMRKNNNPKIPCHRVIRSDGRAGQYNRIGGTATKIKRLRAEGVMINS
jgi:O-6-methylguanine DNA methyltransferase